MMYSKTALQHILRHPLVIASFLALSVSVVILGAAAGLVWEPARVDAAEAEAGLDNASAKLRELKYRARLASDFVTRQTQVETLESKLHQAKSEPEFVRDIETLVARTGAAVSQFSSHSAERSGGVNTTYFEFFLNGSYESLRQFVSELPNLNDFVAIERISLERNGKTIRAYIVMKRRQKTA